MMLQMLMLLRVLVYQRLMRLRFWVKLLEDSMPVQHLLQSDLLESLAHARSFLVVCDLALEQAQGFYTIA